MSNPETAAALEWTPVTPRQPTEDDRRSIGEELDSIRVALGLSDRALADAVGVDRTTLRKVLNGDPTVMVRKWRMIERQIRQLDDEMSSERQEPAADPSAPSTVELRLPSGDGDVVVRGPIENLEALTAAVVELRRRYLEGQDQFPPD